MITSRQLFSFLLLSAEELTYFFILYTLLFHFEPTISGDPSHSPHSPPPYLDDTPAKPHNKVDWAFLVGVCVVFGLAQLSFIRAVFPSARDIPSGWSIQSSDNIAIKYSFFERDHKGDIRRCKKCAKIKPDRSHHCSRCDRCILKMDHHCPFLANCIGFSNYKFFILFLWYTVLFGFITIAAGGYHIYVNVNDHVNAKLLDYFIVVAAAFCVIALLVLIPFLGTHFRLIFYNMTTIEHIEKRSRFSNLFDLGTWRNFAEVFGNNPLLWFLPVWSSKGDGLAFITLPPTERSSLLLHT